MNDFILGTLAIIVGALFCFRGYLTMRFVIPVWGAFAGFVLGAGLVSGLTGDGFLSGFLAWIVGIAVGLLFGLIAYAYYEVSIIIGMAAIGFTLGVSVMAALDVDWRWVQILVGIAVAVVLALVSVLGNLPMVLLTVLSALAGSSTIVAGIMLYTGDVEAGEVAGQAVIDVINDSPWWWLLYAVLAIVGIGSQISVLGRLEGSLRDQWVADGGRQIRES